MSKRTNFLPLFPAVPADFPLRKHPSGKWRKRIKHKDKFFGRYNDPDGALAEYKAYLAKLEEAAAQETCAYTLRQLCGAMLNAYQQRVGNKKDGISESQFHAMTKTAKNVKQFFGEDRVGEEITKLEWLDFRNHLDGRFGEHRFNSEITRTKQIFKWCAEYDLCSPFNFGPQFKRVGKKEMRIAGANNRTVAFSDPVQLLSIINGTDRTIRAMMLLGINAAYNNVCVSKFPFEPGATNERLDDFDGHNLEGGWCGFWRPKTMTPRLVQLWPETLEAIDDYKRRRPKPEKGLSKFERTRLFISSHGRTYLDKPNNSPISKRFGTVLLKKQAKKPGLSFRSLRKTFATQGQNAKADNCKDTLQFMMGQTESSMLTHYVNGEDIDRARLRAVSEHVKGWLDSVPSGAEVEPQPLRIVG